MKTIAFISGLLLLSPLAFGQAGDRGNEVQTPRVPKEIIPPAPALTAEEALKTFKLPEGFKIEIVASDPMIQSPVAIQFDPDGRMWVLEMRGYMPNERGEGETEPVGRISILEDLNGDGRMDRSRTYLDHLMMPRAFMLIRGGLLVAEPPLLWFYRDTNGDGAPDARTLVADDYAVPANPLLGTRANVEHASNGLLWALDNWIYSANHSVRLRNLGEGWERDPTISRGQWGLSQDNFGRLFYNSNSDQLRADLAPAEYLSRNPNYGTGQGANYRVAVSQEVWPGRVNPGVNRGYQLGQLREDGTLATFTGACGPVVYRGINFPQEYQGSAFVCEPTGNLVRRNVLNEADGILTAVNGHARTEFLTSTDERFRPVNSYNGPDGALYIVDMHHGIIQHRVYVTTYLLNQILDRGLQKPVNQGRVYRVVYQGGTLAPRPSLGQATTAELVKNLANPNGWWRDTAQRLLVERNDPSAIADLRKVATSPSEPLGQIHSLWTSDGMNRPDKVAILAGFGSTDAKVRATAIRVSEKLFATSDRDEITSALVKLADDSEVIVQRQLAFSLGELHDERADQALARILARSAPNAYLRDAVLSSLGGRELEFVERLLGDSLWSAREPSAGQAEALGSLARAVFNEGKSSRIERLLGLIAGKESTLSWRQLALLDGVLGDVGGTGGGAARGGGRGGAAGGAGGRAGAGAGAPGAAVTPAAGE